MPAVMRVLKNLGIPGAAGAAAVAVLGLLAAPANDAFRPFNGVMGAWVLVTCLLVYLMNHSALARDEYRLPLIATSASTLVVGLTIVGVLSSLFTIPLGERTILVGFQLSCPGAGVFCGTACAYPAIETCVNDSTVWETQTARHLFGESFTLAVVMYYASAAALVTGLVVLVRFFTGGAVPPTAADPESAGASGSDP